MKRKTAILLVLTVAAAVLAVLSIAVFSLMNQENISRNNREYLLDNTSQMVLLVDDSLMHGLTNIQALSTLAGEQLTSPELDVAALQRILDNSIFDFIEFADQEGWDHNTTGGISDARDRQYYLEAMEGRTGIELIFKSRATMETLLMFYAPVYYQEQKIIGSLAGVYQGTRQMEKLLASDIFGYTAEAYLCNEDGLIIASNQGVDTTAKVPIQTVLGPRLASEAAPGSLLYQGETSVIPLQGNETGACIMGLEHSGWYIVQIFPEQANRLMIANANRIGVGLAAFLVVILTVLLVLTYLILNRSRAETQRALEQAEIASKAKSAFLFNMSHDIRTPMNAIIGFTNFGLESSDPEEQREYLKKIDVSSRQLLDLVNNILELSKIENRKITVEEELVNVRENCDRLCTMLEGDLKQRQLDFTTQIELDHPYLYMDATHYAQIFLNLAGNAIKYTPDGGRVTVSVREDGGDAPDTCVLETVVQDSGIGMSEEFLAQAFESFARERTSTVSGIQGTGLGLTIVKELVELMRGTIQLESRQGQGTRVTVRLPLRLGGAPAEKTCPGGDDGCFQGLRILLAEDIDINAIITTKLLTSRGCVVDRARDGVECVDMLLKAEPGRYGLVLMDIQMPNMDGYQAAQTIRAFEDREKASILILALTANAFQEDHDRAVAVGMNGHVAKPLDASKLFQAIAEALQWEAG